MFRAGPEGGSSSGGEKRKLNQEGLSGGGHWMFCSTNTKRGRVLKGNRKHSQKGS